MNVSSEKGYTSPEYERPPARSGAAPRRTDSLEDQGDHCSMTFPEGGREAWGVVFGSFCLFMSVFGIINTSAVFQSYFLENQLKQYSPSEVGWIFSTYLFVVYFVGLGVGPVFDHHGVREIVFVGSSVMVASPFILGSCTEYYQIFGTFSILMGLGGALLNNPAYAAIGHFFDRRRGLATGLAATAGSIGGIVFPLILQATLPRLGYPWSMRVLGFILVALAVPANLLVRTRLPPAEETASLWPNLRLFLDPKLACCCGGIFFMEWGVLIPLTYVVSYAADHGLDPGQSYILPALLNTGSVLGRAIPGYFADRWGRFNMIILTVGLCAVSVLSLWLPARGSKAILIVFTIVLGFASGGNVSLLPVCVGQLCDSRDYGRFLSSSMLVASFGTLTGIPIGGALLKLQGETGWTALILFSALSYVASVGFYVGARVQVVGWRLKAIY
ncbi:major facilitator superfamily domain-containing protein [Diaporthe sp. PMI_573]|nr:major facilitator superfamily domain-containing protein [Diaporthaceae sp. PMI_573]